MTKQILLIKSDPPEEVIQATSLIKAFDRLYKNYRLVWVTSEFCAPYLKFNRGVKKIFTTDDIHSTLKGASVKLREYDIAINLDYNAQHADYLSQIDAKEKVGFIIEDDKIVAANKKAEYYIKMQDNDYFKEKNTSNYFQIIYQICGIKWKGQGYAVHYKPQKKPNKVSLGIVSNVENSQSISKKLKDLNIKPKILNYSTNPLTVMHDVWKCRKILCQPDYYMHTALAYHKNVIVANMQDPKSNYCFFGQKNNVLKTENEDEIVEHVVRTVKNERTSMHGRPKDSDRLWEDLPPSE